VDQGNERGSLTLVKQLLQASTRCRRSVGRFMLVGCYVKIIKPLLEVHGFNVKALDSGGW
jgi:hypothetical protein